MMVNGMTIGGIDIMITRAQRMIHPMIGGVTDMMQSRSGEGIRRVLYLKRVIGLFEDYRAGLRR